MKLATSRYLLAGVCTLSLCSGCTVVGAGIGGMYAAATVAAGYDTTNEQKSSKIEPVSLAGAMFVGGALGAVVDVLVLYKLGVFDSKSSASTGPESNMLLSSPAVLRW